MKFYKKYKGYGDFHFEGKKNNFKFKYYISSYDKILYVVVNHIKKDIRFNTLWENINFKNENELIEWCENFNYKNHKCLGDNI